MLLEEALQRRFACTGLQVSRHWTAVEVECPGRIQQLGHTQKEAVMSSPKESAHQGKILQLRQNNAYTRLHIHRYFILQPLQV